MRAEQRATTGQAPAARRVLRAQDATLWISFPDKWFPGRGDPGNAALCAPAARSQIVVHTHKGQRTLPNAEDRFRPPKPSPEKRDFPPLRVPSCRVSHLRRAACSRVRRSEPGLSFLFSRASLPQILPGSPRNAPSPPGDSDDQHRPPPLSRRRGASLSPS